MIPILYDSYELAFTSNGLGRLADCVSCTVTEERNGIYECEFQYPVTGEMYSQIKEGRIIGVTHDDAKDIQPFDIYARSAPLDGVVTFYAHHISYRLSNVILKPFTATTCAQTMAKLQSSTYNSNIFTFWTDKSVTANFEQKVPDSVRAVLAGKEGSVLDVYGTGEYEFDKLAVKLHLNRGNDNGVSIRYGVNLTDLTHDYDQSGTYSAVAPYWVNKDDGSVVSLPGGYVISSEVTAIQEPWTTGDGEIMTTGDGDPICFNAPKIIPVPMDLSDAFEEEPTVAQLQTEALRRLNNSEAWLPSENLTVSFVNLADTEEYASMSALQRVKLCDKVSVYCGPLGVSAAKMQVIRVVYNVLDNRYDEIELGKAKLSFAETILAKVDDNINKATEDLVSNSRLQEAVDNATNMITGATNSHVKFVYDANGGLQEILVMDTEDINTAVNIWRWNSGGLGFSSNGYAGPYSTAMTADGAIVADMITTGVLNADLIQAGVIDGTLVQAKLLQIIDAVGAVIASFDDTITLGLNTKGRLSISQNSMYLQDSNDFMYMRFGDLYDSTAGYASTVDTFIGDGVTTQFICVHLVSYFDSQVPSVTINGTTTTDYVAGTNAISVGDDDYVDRTHRTSSHSYKIIKITFATAPSSGDVIRIYYKSIEHIAYFDFGMRDMDSSIGRSSACIGDSNTVMGNYSVAFGLDNVVYSEYSKSSGRKNKIYAGTNQNPSRFNNAEGIGNHIDMAYGCHAEGYSNKIVDPDGYHTAYYAHVEGRENVAVGNQSHVEGMGNKNIHRSQHCLGEYCVEDKLNYDPYTYDLPSMRGNYIEVVGKGTSDSSRSNARTLDWSGNEWIAGTLTQASDARLKEESGDVPDVSTIRARRFKWNDQGTHDDDDHIGYYAQDVEQVAPYLVHEDAMGYKSLDYIGFLCAKVESLERRIAELEKGRE